MVGLRPLSCTPEEVVSSGRSFLGSPQKTAVDAHLNPVSQVQFRGARRRIEQVLHVAADQERGAVGQNWQEHHPSGRGGLPCIVRCPAGGRSRQEGAGPPLPVVGGNAESGTRGSADAGGDFHGRGSLHKGDVVVTCRSVEHVRHAENAAPDLEWFETAIGKVTFVEDRAGGAAGPAALKDEVVLPVVQERADNAKLRSARDRAADKVLRRRGYGVRPVVVTAEVELQAARERDAVSSVGATDRRPVAGGHPDARCVGGRRRSGRNHLFGGPSGFFPPLRNVPFQGRDFVLQLADFRLQRLQPGADGILCDSGPAGEDHSDSRRRRE